MNGQALYELTIKIKRVNAMSKLIISIFCCLFLLSSFTNAGEHHDEFKWKDLRVACKGDHDSEECKSMRAEARKFCKSNPDKKRCRKLHAMKACRQNPDSEKCSEYKERFKTHCKENPGSKKCVRARLHKICKDDPESQECVDGKQKIHEHFCNKHPNHEKCI